ncbi:MAG: hypothetical protein AAGB11_03085 [Pseudomonadota bacterium]
MPDIKNPKTEFQSVDTDAVSKVWIGGGKNDAANIVGQEFADITGGSHINVDELDDLLAAILTSKGLKDVPGLEGVELASLTTESFILAISGAGGSTDYIEFTGSAAKAAIDAVAGDRINLYSNKSELTIFDTDEDRSLILNGKFLDNTGFLSEEFRDLVEDNRIHTDEIDDVLGAVLGGKGWGGPEDHGLESVDLVSLTDNEFALKFNGRGATSDTVVFKGNAAQEAIEAVAKNHIDIKDNKTALGIFDLAEDDTFFLGGGASDKSIVSDGFNDLVAGSKLASSEVLSIFEAIVSGGKWGDPQSNGVKGVALVGKDNDSFAIALDAAGPSTDYIIFDNVHLLEGAEAYGFKADDTPA